MSPILGLCRRSHLYATFSLQPTFLGSFHSSLTYMYSNKGIVMVFSSESPIKEGNLINIMENNIVFLA